MINTRYSRAAKEAMASLTLGRAANEVAVGDLINLSISFACKDVILEWSWLGIDLAERPPQRLDWEMYRVEHLAYVSNMEASVEGSLQYPSHVCHSALRRMACQNWQSQHSCPICRRPDRNQIGGKDPWSYMSGCLEHLQCGAGCRITLARHYRSDNGPDNSILAQETIP